MSKKSTPPLSSNEYKLVAVFGTAVSVVGIFAMLAGLKTYISSRVCDISISLQHLYPPQADCGFTGSIATVWIGLGIFIVGLVTITVAMRKHFNWYKKVQSGEVIARAWCPNLFGDGFYLRVRGETPGGGTSVQRLAVTEEEYSSHGVGDFYRVSKS